MGAMTTATKRVSQTPPRAKPGRLWRDDCASQIVEFALSLPLLVFLVVGIFDFSNALTLKQRLTNAAREAARVAASDPATDLVGYSTTAPVSIGDAFQVVDNYLISENINDCGLSTSAPTSAGLKWTYTSTGTCPGTGITLLIDRGCINQISANSSTVDLVGTCVTIIYPYKWEFNNVASSFGWTGSGPSTITVLAGAMNEN
jgi:Flp pilus assembly protein TadG